MRTFFRRVFRRTPRTLSSLEAYQLWAELYPPHAHNALMRVEQDAMTALLPALTDCRVLDLASGTGRYAHLATARGAHSVIALDNSAPMLERNKAHARALATMERLPLRTSSIEVVLCGLAIGHLAVVEPVLNEIVRVLTRRGVALISDVHPSLFVNGARRTFQAHGATYAVQHTPHSLSSVVMSARAAGLVLTALAEPSIDAQKDEHLSPVPVVVVYRFERERT